MKKSLNYFLAAVACLALLFACTKNEEESKTKESLRLDQTSLSVSADAGSSDIVLSSTGVTPEVTSDSPSWLSATITTRVLTVTYTANESEEQRVGTLTVTAGSLNAQTVTVTQAGAKPSGPTTLEIGALTEDGKGVVYYVSKDGNSGMAISIERTTGIAWSTLTSLVGADSYVNGSANQATILSSVSSPEESYPAFYYCSQLGDGWYVPAVNELLQIFDIYNGIAHDSEGFEARETANLLAEEKAARAVFNGYLTAQGGEEMDNATSGKGNAYWSSTEVNTTDAYYVRFGKYMLASGDDVTKNKTSRYIRCVKAIGDFTYPAEPVVITSVVPSSVTLEGDASSADVTVEVKNGALFSAEVDADAAAWLSASVNGNIVTVSATANDSGNRRSGVVTVVASGAAGQTSTTLKVEQKVPVKADPFKLLETYSEDGKVVGVVFWVSDDGQSAKVIALKRSEKIAWAVKDAVSKADSLLVGASSTSDGAINTAAIREFVKASPEDVPALAYLDGLGEGWYWPAIDELQTLFETYNGTKFSDATNQKPEKISDAEKEARAAFEKVLTDNGGDKINAAADDNNGEQYLASTEVDNLQVYSFRFGKRAKNTDTGKTGTTRMVRGVKLVTK